MLEGEWELLSFERIKEKKEEKGEEKCFCLFLREQSLVKSCDA